MKPAAALEDFLLVQSLARSHDEMRWTPLAGSVSSDIWRVDLPECSLCLERALPKLKVAANWYAPTERNVCEWKWLQFAALARPSSGTAPGGARCAGGPVRDGIP